VAVALSLLILTAGMLGGGFLRFVFMTPVEADMVVANLTMPQGTPSSVTGEAIRRIEDAATRMQHEIDGARPDTAPSVISHRLTAVGEHPFRNRAQAGPMGTAIDSASGSHLGEVQLEIVESRQRSHSAGKLASLWRDEVGEIAGVEELAFSSSLVSVGAPILIQLRSADLAQLQSAADTLKARLAGYPGVFDISDSFHMGKQELELAILPSGESLGVTLGDLARQVRQGFYGDEAQSIQRGADEVKVMVRYPADERRSLADVEGMRIQTRDGSRVPFSAVAEAKLGRGFSVIRRTDRRRVLDVSADVDLAVANPNEIVRDLKLGALEEVLELFPGVRYSFEGEQADQREFLAALAAGQLIALFAIYALLAVPLRSYLQPLIIMSAIPFGLVGAAWGHVLLGYDFNMSSMP